MSKLTEALEDKILELVEERSALDVQVDLYNIKISALEDLLNDELGESKKKKTSYVSKKMTKKKGRPRKKKVDSEVQSDYENSLKSLPGGQGTTPEEAEAARRRYSPSPRPEQNYGGVRHGTKADVLDAPKEPKGGINLTIGDDGEEE